MNYQIKRALTPRERDRFGALPDLTAQLLFHRGIVDAASAQEFLVPDYERQNLDPLRLKDASRAADRILQAILAGEKVAIYADYDADGIPGAAMFHDFFGRIGFSNFVIYIPHRHDEGFGLNKAAVESLAAEGVRLIVTLDCGVSDVAAVAHANALGLQVIITDHHEPPPVPPPALAIVDPKQSDCSYPDKNLCGTGVAFKLIQALISRAATAGKPLPLKTGHEKWLLDLVGLATLSDMVPLVGENRLFGHYGLTVLRKSPRKGLRRLFERLRLDQAHLSEDDLAFMVTPRVNAASRMGVPRDAFDLLVAGDDATALARAEHLDRVNDERKGVVAALVKEIKHTLHERHGEQLPAVLVLGNPSWRPSLLGLAANACAEEFDRPAFFWGRDGDNVIKGSCRSEGRTHVVELMRAAPAGTFMQFGGHKHSGGFSVDNGAIHYLEQRLNEAAVASAARKSPLESNATASDQTDEASIDAELRLDDVTAKLYDEVSRLAPFGVGNPKPIFLFRNIPIAEIRVFGKGREHVELVFTRTAGAGGRLSAIAFFGVGNAWAKELSVGQRIDLIASLEKSFFRGRPELRLRVIDVLNSAHAKN